MNRGEVWWMEQPDAGRRPILVLTRQSALPVLKTIVVVPATRTVRGIPTEVTLTRDDGMPEECVLSLDNVTTIPRELLTERITRLGAGRMGDVCAALMLATGCA